MSERLSRISAIRAENPEAIGVALKNRARRPLLGNDGRLFIVAADHPARGVTSVSSRPGAMGDREDLLARLETALSRPGVDGVLATPDIVEELALLGALEERVVFGSMNRGGLTASSFELDDRFTAYDAAALERDGLDGGKMMIRIADEDEATLRTIEATAQAIDELAARKLPAMVEVFATAIESGRPVNRNDADSLIRAIGIASALGGTSAYHWLKLPVVEELPRVLAATSLPTLLLGGDPGAAGEGLFSTWAEAMSTPQVRGLVAGRVLLYPEDDDVAGAVDRAAAIVRDAPIAAT